MTSVELWPEAEPNRLDDHAEPWDSHAAGSTPTRTGAWVGPILIKQDPEIAPNLVAPEL